MKKSIITVEVEVKVTELEIIKDLIDIISSFRDEIPKEMRIKIEELAEGKLIKSS